MFSIEDNLQFMREKIAVAEKKYHREKNSVTLLAVSKNQPIEKIKVAYEAGQRKFGESFLQEALQKMQALSNYEIEWHFIGNIQSNKTKKIAENFAWVHSLSRSKIARRLHEHRPVYLPPLNVCIEVNISHEITKSGINEDKLMQLAYEIARLKNLCLHGLMIMPKFTNNKQLQWQTFRQTVALQQKLKQQGFFLDTISMGMSNDFEMAIAAGSTLVRIGTAIFGKRGTQ